MKCPHAKRMQDPLVAASDANFCCEIVGNQPQLKRSSEYYIQIQGQLALTGAKWCDFVLYTNKGILIECIMLDETKWADVAQKLDMFYFNHLLPVLAQKSGVN